MTPSALLLIALAVVALPLVLVLLFVRRSRNRFDAGSVSTRWISELRRDEPWTGR
jgi:hypothetical protein